MGAVTSNVVELLEPRRLLAAGNVDRSFGAEGTVLGAYTLPLTTTVRYQTPSGVIVQPDGKTIVFGYRFIARFNRDGSPDGSFGRAGLAQLPEGSPARNLDGAIDEFGRIVLAGSEFDSSRGDAGLKIVRLLPNGTPDPAFGVAGVGATRVPAGEVPSLRLAIDSAGRPVLGITAAYSGIDHQTLLVRLTQDGNPDRRFGVLGIARFDLFTGRETVTSIARGTDGRILLSIDSEDDPIVTAVRVTPRGRLDRSFDGNGVASIRLDPFGSGYNTRVLPLPDGRVVLTGTTSGARPADWFLREVVAARLLPDGRPDPTFGGGDGTVTSLDWIPTAQFATEWRFSLHSAELTSDGSVCLTLDRTSDQLVQIKLRGNGSLNRGFGREGIRKLGDSNRGGLDEVLGSTRLRADGSTVFVRGEPGDHDLHSASDFRLISIGLWGGPDPSFDAVEAGKIARPSALGASGVLTDGRLVMPGNFLHQTRVVAVRPDGRPSPEFGSEGRASVYDSVARPGTVLPLPDGGFILWNPTADPSDHDPIAVRLHLFTAQGKSRPLRPPEGQSEYWISDETARAVVQTLPGGWVSVTYEQTWNESRLGYLVSPAGQIVDTPFYLRSSGEFGNSVIPDNAALQLVLPGPGGSVYGVGEKPFDIDPGEGTKVVIRKVILRAGGGADLPAFGDGGTVCDIDGVLASDAQGRILYRTRSGLRRLNLDGSRDMTFGRRGTASAAAGFEHLDIDAQGRLIVWRVLSSGPAEGDVQVMRLTPNGRIDPTFGGGDGLAIVDTRLPSTARASLVVSSDDRLVVSAIAADSSRVRWSATRLLG